MMHKMAFITRLLIRFSLLAFCLSWAYAAQAESMRATRAEAVIGSQGQLSVNSRFNTTLPSALQDALKQGVTLNFELNYQLIAPKLLAYNMRFNPLVDTVKPVIYKLSYHPLTDKYRVTVGTFSTEYSQLDTLCGPWAVLPIGKCIPSLLSGAMMQAKSKPMCVLISAATNCLSLFR